MEQTIKVEYRHTNDVPQAIDWLRELSTYPIIACDFETALKYTDEERKTLLEQSEDESLPHLDRMQAKAKYNATALDHPSHTVITHLSVAISDHEATVIIVDSKEMEEVVLDFLTATSTKQVWHNATYDFYHIYYRTGEFPLNYEDTRVYYKTLLNHVDIDKALVGLKQLAGHVYGAWGISNDQFNVSQMYDPGMLLYAATDACATMWLYNKLLRNVENG